MKRRSAFTLVEMLVVITMIGLLMTMVTVGLARARRAAQIARAETQLREILAACGEYLMLNHQAPPGVGSGWVEVGGGMLDELITPDANGFVYLSVSPSQLKNGQYLDPWGLPYMVKLNSATGDMAPPNLVIRASVSFMNKNRRQP